MNTPVSVALDPNVPQDAAIINDDRFDFEYNGTLLCSFVSRSSVNETFA